MKASQDNLWVQPSRLNKLSLSLFLSCLLITGCATKSHPAATPDLTIDLGAGLDVVSIINDIGYKGPDPERSIAEMQAILDFCRSEDARGQKTNEAMLQRYKRFHDALQSARRDLESELEATTDPEDKVKLDALIQRYERVRDIAPRPEDLGCPPDWHISQTSGLELLEGLTAGAGVGEREFTDIPTRTGIRDGDVERALDSSSKHLSTKDFFLMYSLATSRLLLNLGYSQADSSESSSATSAGSDHYFTGFDFLSNGTTGLGFFNDAQTRSDIDFDEKQISAAAQIRTSLWNLDKAGITPYLGLDWNTKKYDYDEFSVVPSIPTISNSAQISLESDAYRLSLGGEHIQPLSPRLSLRSRVGFVLQHSSTDLYAMQHIDFSGTALTSMVEESDDNLTWGLQASLAAEYAFDNLVLGAMFYGQYLDENPVPGKLPESGNDLFLLNQAAELDYVDEFDWQVRLYLRVPL